MKHTLSIAILLVLLVSVKCLSQPSSPMVNGENETTVTYSSNPEANKLFLEAREFYNKSDPRLAGGKLANAREAIRLFEMAISKDPKFALAYVEMSRAWMRLSYSDPDGLSNKEVLPHARGALLDALALDNKLIDAHVALAGLYYNFEYNWQKAECEYKFVLKLDPNNINAHLGYAGYLGSMGRFAEAIAEAEKATAQGSSRPSNTVLARIYYSMRRYDEAETYCKRIFKDQDNVIGHFFLGFVYVAKQKNEEAIAEFKKAASFGNNAGALSGLAYGYAMAGDKDEARRILDELQTNHKGAALVPYRLAAVYLALGDKARAIKLLKQDIEVRDNWMNQLKVDPVMDPLRSDPGFQRIMRQMKFESGQSSRQHHN